MPKTAAAAKNTILAETILPVVLNVPGDARNILAEACRNTYLALPLTAAKITMQADALAASGPLTATNNLWGATTTEAEHESSLADLRAQVDGCYADWQHLGAILDAVYGETIHGGADRSQFDGSVQSHVGVISATLAPYSPHP